MKIVKWTFLSVLLLILTVGCSKAEEPTKEKVTADVKDEEQQENEQKEDEEVESEETKEEPVEAEVYEPEETFEEIAFQNVDWFFGSPDRQPKGGIWLFTAEKHAGELDDTFEWEKEDVLLIQVNDPAYINHEMTIKGLQIVDEKTVKIVAALKEKSSEGDKAPRRYVKVEKDALAGKGFLLEDALTGETIKLN
ncbi:hypothetical protein J2Z40_000290 [Cytobacillus eiseniae]|uniref:Lipoprotein n=1 Tax=Cytobacillus eiseniae TaxID=762947 RepID=A0ABS4RA37_9BACI|nr:hypothetical protein [Cytobacillus eiseniae]MBP2239737.1 hypothetical protein [Cytobacillus eiseniae]